MKIAIHEPMPMSAVAFYRSIGTFSYLKKINKNIEITIPDQISWKSLLGADIFYMERPQHHSDLQGLHLAKDFNLKIWIDYDDNLHEIPHYNPSYKMYKEPGIMQRIEEALSLADIVTVSTPALYEHYSNYSKNVHIIENAHNDYQYPFFKKEVSSGSINWRGSATHRQDLLSVAKDLWSFSEKYKETAWTFIGNDVWYITDRLQNQKNCFVISECDIIDYFKFINELKSSIQIVPLVKNIFNEGKSNIGWIEGTFAGSCTIAPDLPEFRKPGVVNYLYKEDSMFYYLDKTMKSKDFRQKNYNQSFDYIQENLLLSKINKKRIEIIEKII